MRFCPDHPRADHATCSWCADVLRRPPSERFAPPVDWWGLVERARDSASWVRLGNGYADEKEVAMRMIFAAVLDAQKRIAALEEKP